MDIWGEDTVQLTLRGSLKNRHVFEYISEKMNDSGFMRTTDQCYSRIKRLKYGFHHEKSVNSVAALGKFCWTLPNAMTRTMTGLSL